jgi:hypothetical protein
LNDDLNADRSLLSSLLVKRKSMSNMTEKPENRDHQSDKISKDSRKEKKRKDRGRRIKPEQGI